MGDAQEHGVDDLSLPGTIAKWLYDRWQPAPPARETPERLAHRRLAAAVRRLVAETVATGADAATLDAAAGTVEGLAALFANQPRGALHPFDPDPEVPHDPHVWSEWSPILGSSHPLAPPIALADAGGYVVGEVTYGSQFEGPPGGVHGGFIAAAFDDVLGATQTLSGLAGVTGTLTVRYRSLAPLQQPLRYEGRLLPREGRKLTCTGTLHHGDTLCAEGEAIFVLNQGMLDTLDSDA